MAKMTFIKWWVYLIMPVIFLAVGLGVYLQNQNDKTSPTLIVENSMIVEDEFVEQTDAASSSIVKLRYWDVTNPNVKYVKEVDTNGSATTYYHLSILENGNYLRNWSFRVKLRQNTWNGKKFVDNVPSYVKPVKYIITADTTWIPDPEQPQGGYYVIGERYQMNPEYIAFEDNFWSAVGDVEELMRERMVIRNKRVFTYVPSGSNYRWEMFIDGSWRSVPVDSDKYTGRPVWVETNSDLYYHFAKWVSMYTSNKEYFIAYGQLAIQ